MFIACIFIMHFLLLLPAHHALSAHDFSPIIDVDGYLMAFSDANGMTYVLLCPNGTIIRLESDAYNLFKWINSWVHVRGLLYSDDLALKVLSLSCLEWEDRDIAFGFSLIASLNYSPIGIQPTCVIPIEFSDVPHEKNLSDVIELVELAGESYFKEVSYGLTWFNVCCPFINWILMSNPMSYYASDTDDKRLELIQDAVEAASSLVDLSHYPRVVIVHSGNDEALTGNSSDILSFATVGEIDVEINGVTRKISFAIVSEFDPLGVIAHEMGHMLGLPDLYDYSFKEEFVGKWGLMGKGMWNGVPIGSSPAHLLSFCKLALGWIPSSDVIIISPGEARIVHLNPLEVSSGLRVIKIEVSEESYFLIEVRRKSGYDLYLPGEGVLIYFVNESVPPGQGPIRLVDAKPKTASLNDAYFTVHKLWSNGDLMLAVKVLSKHGSSFKLLVYYNDTAVVDSASVTRWRADVGSTQEVKFHVKWNGTGEDAGWVTLNVNGSTYTTNGDGWISFEVTSSQVCRQIWNVSSASIDDFAVPIVMDVEPPSIIWDQVVVELYVPEDKLRVNVNSNATIYYKAYYAYDREPFEGTVVLNGTTFGIRIGPVYFKVAKIYDHKYGLWTFKSNTVMVVFDALKVYVEPSKPICNPGERIQINVKLTYASDDRPIAAGIVDCNGSRFTTGIGGTASITLTAPEEVGPFTVFVHGVSDGHSVTLPYNRLMMEIFVTKILIDDITPRNVRVQVDKPIKVFFHAIWAHNSSSAPNVVIRILEHTLRTNETGWASLLLARSSITKVDLIVLDVHAPMDITSFEQLVQSYVIWDRVRAEVAPQAWIPGSARIIVKLSYEYDASPVVDADVLINGMRALAEADGVYVKTVSSWAPLLGIEVEIRVENFDVQFKHIDVIMFGNIAMYVSAIVAILAMVIVLARKIGIELPIPLLRRFWRK